MQEKDAQTSTNKRHRRSHCGGEPSVYVIDKDGKLLLDHKDNLLVCLPILLSLMTLCALRSPFNCQQPPRFRNRGESSSVLLERLFFGSPRLHYTESNAKLVAQLIVVRFQLFIILLVLHPYMIVNVPPWMDKSSYIN